MYPSTAREAASSPSELDSSVEGAQERLGGRPLPDSPLSINTSMGPMHHMQQLAMNAGQSSYHHPHPYMPHPMGVGGVPPGVPGVPGVPPPHPGLSAPGVPGVSGLPPHMSRDPAASAQFKVKMWQSMERDSGMATMSHSQAPSMMSMTSLHAGSQISTLSSHIGEGELSEQQQCRFDALPSADRAIPELLLLMQDGDEAVVYKAVLILQNIAKKDADEQKLSPPLLKGRAEVAALGRLLGERRAYPNIIRVSLGALFHMCQRGEGLELVASVCAEQPGMLRDLVQHIGTVHSSCHKYALLILHSLLSEKTAGQRTVDAARRLDAIRAVSSWLDHEKSEKLLPVIVDTVRILCERSSEQKTLFISSLSGVRRLLHVLSRFHYENLLWRTTQLLKALSNFNPQSLVLSNAQDVLSLQLEHASPRLVLASLECLRNLSDVPLGEGMDPRPLLFRLLRLFGHANAQIVLYTVQILSNMIANHKESKEFLVQQNAVAMLLRVMREVPCGVQMGDKAAQLIEDMHERILATLRHLCLKHDFSQEVQVEVFRQPHLFLEKLLDMRPAILRQTLLVLNKAASQEANLAAFRELRLPRRDAPHLSTTFAEQIVHLLRVACSQLATTLRVEDVKVADLIFLAQSTLQQLARDRGMLWQIVHFLKQPENARVNDTQILLPLFSLQQQCVDDEPLRKSALALIAALVHHPEIHAFFSSSPDLMQLMQQCARSPVASIAAYAQQSLRVLSLPPGAAEAHSPGAQAQPSLFAPPPMAAAGAGYYPGAQQQRPPACPYQSAPSLHHSSTPQRGASPQPGETGVDESALASLAPSVGHSTGHSAGPSRAEPAEMEEEEGEGTWDANVEREGTWPEDLESLQISDDPFVGMFCGTSREERQAAPPTLQQPVPPPPPPPNHAMYPAHVSPPQYPVNYPGYPPQPHPQQPYEQPWPPYPPGHAPYGPAPYPSHYSYYGYPPS